MSNLSKTTKSAEVSSLYVLKALCAFGVVALHAPWGMVSEYVRLLASVAVPIFYMVTGYFLYTEDRDRLQSKLLGSIKKVALVILITNIVYTILHWRAIPSLSEYMLWFKWIALGQHFAAGHLWYLTALVEALILLYLLTHLGWHRCIPYLSLCLVFKFIFEDYKPLLFGSEASIMSANVLFYSIPFVSLGWLLRRTQARCLALPYMPWFVLLSIVLTFVNKFVLPTGALQSIVYPWGRLAMTCTLFVCAMQYSGWGRGTQLEYIGKNLSGNIYYWHDLMISLSSVLLCSCIFDDWAAPIVMLLSLLFSELIYRSQQKLGIHWLP